jgi:hypothetical protein
VDRSAPAAKNLQPGYRYLVTAIDGQSPANLTEAAKILYGRKKGEKVQLGVVALRRRGNLAMYQQGTVEVPIR